MRKLLLASWIGFALLAPLACVDPAGEPTGDRIGDRIAGTWLGSYKFGGPEEQRAAFITTYHPDGTGFTTSARAWGAGDPERHGMSSTHHIQWEETGPNSIRWRLLHFGHNVDGTLRYLSRTHGSVEFDEQFESGTVSFQVEVFKPDDLLDPLDPNSLDAVPFFTTSGSSGIRRHHAGGPAHGSGRM